MGSYRVETDTTCVSEIKIRLKGDIVKETIFEGGCQPMYQAINKLIEGRNINEVIDLLKDIDTKCANKETCISKLLNLLINSKDQEMDKQKEKDDYRVSTEGLFKNLSTLISKPNIDFDRKYILIKINSDVYDTVLESISNLPIYIEKLKKEDNTEIQKLENLINKDIDSKDEATMEKVEKLKDTKTKTEEHIALLNKITKQLDTIATEINDEFEGDYIFNTIWKE